MASLLILLFVYISALAVEEQETALIQLLTGSDEEGKQRELIKWHR